MPKLRIEVRPGPLAVQVTDRLAQLDKGARWVTRVVRQEEVDSGAARIASLKREETADRQTGSTGLGASPAVARRAAAGGETGGRHEVATPGTEDPPGIGSRPGSVAPRISGAPETTTPSVDDLPGLAVFVIGDDPADPDLDVVLSTDLPLDDQLDRLWRHRIEPMARFLSGETGPPSPKAVLREHDPRYRVIADRLLRRLRSGLSQQGIADGTWTFDHIGSTSVPDLAAKPYVDLQLGVDPLPEEESPFDAVLAAAGFLPARGARADSPGVYRDTVKDPGLAPDDAYRKRLYVRPDPGGPAVLHVRRLGSPWWSYTVLFRDWLRAGPAGRRAYEATKLRLAQAHADDPDYDDYTRAKAAFFTEVQEKYERLGAASAYRVRR